MEKIKMETDISVFPDEIKHLFENTTVYDSSCSEEARVYYLDTGYYVKTAPLHSLASEATAGKLFYEKGLGVEIVSYISADRDYLVTRSAHGLDLTHCLDNPEKLCRILATALRRLHLQPVETAPLSPKHYMYMAAADSKESDGSYDEKYILGCYRMTKSEAWNIMQKNRHLLGADSLIHGDACLPNIIWSDDFFTSFIDFSMAGAGDKHIDLYWAIWSLQFNLKTDSYTDMFLDMYGRDNFSEEILRTVAAYEYFG
ncbi:MAG: phosphotransferase [Oscillospiraceae bacterium]|nr:phosphotransferase [Oscillospiraceae bacterium]